MESNVRLNPIKELRAKVKELLKNSNPAYIEINPIIQSGTKREYFRIDLSKDCLVYIFRVIGTNRGGFDPEGSKRIMSIESEFLTSALNK